LNGLFGRKSGSVAGYNYSEANKNSGITWDDAVFAEYIKDPKAKIRHQDGLRGIKKEDEIKDLTAFLKQFAPTARRSKTQCPRSPRKTAIAALETIC
jgi:cytochrome c